MKICIEEIRKQLAECGEAEAELATIGARIRTERADLQKSEAEVSAEPHDSKSFNKCVGQLEAKRRSISDLEYRAALLERNAARLREALHKTGSALIRDARTLGQRLRDAVMSELRNRITPFVGAKSAQTLIRIGDVRCLATPLKLCASLEGHSAQLRTNPVAACARIVATVDALNVAASGITAELGIAA